MQVNDIQLHNKKWTETCINKIDKVYASKHISEHAKNIKHMFSGEVCIACSNKIKIKCLQVNYMFTCTNKIKIKLLQVTFIYTCTNYIIKRICRQTISFHEQIKNNSLDG